MGVVLVLVTVGAVVILGVLTVACGGLGWFAYQRLGDRPGRIAKGSSQPNAFTGGADRQSWFEETATEKDWLDKNGPVEVVYLSDLAEIDVQMRRSCLFAGSGRRRAVW